MSSSDSENDNIETLLAEEEVPSHLIETLGDNPMLMNLVASQIKRRRKVEDSIQQQDEKETELTVLQSTVLLLENELKEKTEEIDKLRHHKTSNEVGGLTRDDKLDQDSKLQQLTLTVQQLEKQTDELERLLRISNEEKEAMRLQENQNQSIVANLKLSLEKSTHDYDDLNSRLEVSLNANKDLHDQIVSANQKHTFAMAQHVVDLKMKDDELETAVSVRAELSTRITELEAMVEAISASTQDKEAVHRELIKSKDHDLVHSQSLSSSLERQSLALHTQVDQLKADLVRANEIQEKIAAQVQAGEKELERIKLAHTKEAEARANELHALQKQYEEKCEQLLLVQNAQPIGHVPLAPIARRLLEKENLTVTELFQQISDLEGLTHRQRADYAKLSAYLDDLCKTMEEKAPEYQQMKIDYTYMRQVADETATINLELTNQIEKLRRDCDDSRRQAVAAAKTIGDLQIQLDHAIEASARTIKEATNSKDASNENLDYEALLKSNVKLAEDLRKANQMCDNFSQSTIDPSIVSDLEAKQIQLEQSNRQLQDRIETLIRERDIYRELSKRPMPSDKAKETHVEGGTGAAVVPSISEKVDLQLEVEKLKKALEFEQSYRSDDSLRAKEQIDTLKKDLIEVRDRLAISEGQSAFSSTRLDLIASSSKAKDKELRLLHQRQKSLYGQLVKYESQLESSTQTLANTIEKCSLAEAQSQHADQQIKILKEANERAANDLSASRKQMLSMEQLYIQLQHTTEEHQRLHAKECQEWERQKEVIKQHHSQALANQKQEAKLLEDRISSLRINLSVAETSLLAETNLRVMSDRENVKNKKALDEIRQIYEADHLELLAARESLLMYTKMENGDTSPLARLEREIKRLQGDLALSRTETTREKENSESLRERTVELERTNQEEEKIITQIKQEIEDVRLEMNNKEEYLIGIRAEHASQLAKFQEIADKAMTSERSVQRSLDQLQESYAILKTNYDGMNTKFPVKVRELDSLRVTHQRHLLELSNKIKDLQSTRDALTASKEELQHQKDQTNQITALLVEVREKADAAEATSQSERKMHLGLINELEKRITGLVEIVASLTTKADSDSPSNVARFGNELQLAASHCDVYRVKLEVANQTGEATQLELQEAQRQLVETQKSLATANQNCVNLEKTIQENQALLAEMASMKRQVESNATLRREKKEALDRETSAKESGRYLKESVDDFKAKLALAETKVDQLSSKIEELQSKLAQQELKNEQQRDIMEAMSTDRLEVAERDVIRLTGQLESTTNQNAQLEKECERLKPLAENTEKLMDELNTLREDKNNAVMQLGELAKWKEENSADSVVRKLKGMSEKFKRILTKQRDDVVKANEMAEAMKKKTEEMEHQLEEVKKGTELEAVRSEFEKIKKELVEKTAEASKYKEMVTDLKAERDALIASTTTLTTNQTNLEVRVNELEKSKALLEDKTKALATANLKSRLESQLGNKIGRPEQKADALATKPVPTPLPPAHQQSLMTSKSSSLPITESPQAPTIQSSTVSSSAQLANLVPSVQSQTISTSPDQSKAVPSNPSTSAPAPPAVDSTVEKPLAPPTPEDKPARAPAGTSSSPRTTGPISNPPPSSPADQPDNKVERQRKLRQTLPAFYSYIRDLLAAHHLPNPPRGQGSTHRMYMGQVTPLLESVGVSFLTLGQYADQSHYGTMPLPGQGPPINTNESTKKEGDKVDSKRGSQSETKGENALPHNGSTTEPTAGVGQSTVRLQRGVKRPHGKSEGDLKRPRPVTTTPPEITPAESQPAVLSVENPLSAPEIPTETPEIPAQTPEIPTETPEIPAQTPEIPTQTPEIPTQTPEIPTQTPEILTQTPEIPTQTPEIPTQTPEIPTQIPEFPAQTPEISETLEIPNQTPETTGVPVDITSHEPLQSTTAEYEPGQLEASSSTLETIPLVEDQVEKTDKEERESEGVATVERVEEETLTGNGPLEGTLGQEVSNRSEDMMGVGRDRNDEAPHDTTPMVNGEDMEDGKEIDMTEKEVREGEGEGEGEGERKSEEDTMEEGEVGTDERVEEGEIDGEGEEIGDNGNTVEAEKVGEGEVEQDPEDNAAIDDADSNDRPNMAGDRCMDDQLDTSATTAMDPQPTGGDIDEQPLVEPGEIDANVLVSLGHEPEINKDNDRTDTLPSTKSTDLPIIGKIETRETEIPVQPTSELSLREKLLASLRPRHPTKRPAEGQGEKKEKKHKAVNQDEPTS